MIKLQLLNKRHYNSIIPFMLSQLDMQGSRLICWQFEQIVVYDVFSRRKFFYTHFKLERPWAAFSVIKNIFVLFGGQCVDHNELNGAKDKSEFQVMPYQMLPGAECDFKPLPESRLHFPRRRHVCVSDQQEWIYILGSSMMDASNKMERYSI